MSVKADKYFWDGQDGYSDDFRIRRLLEYAAFPDLLDIPFDNFKIFLIKTDIDRLRTSENRKEFLKMLIPYLNKSGSIKDAVLQIINNYFKE